MAKSILLIDDEPDLVQLTSFRLKQAGYVVHTALTGTEGLERAKCIQPDLIILDLNLPEIMGAEVCRLLKSDERYRAIPIIIISASSERLQERAAECGAEAFILKPYEIQDFLGTIRKIIG